MIVSESNFQYILVVIIRSDTVQIRTQEHIFYYGTMVHYTTYLFCHIDYTQRRKMCMIFFKYGIVREFYRHSFEWFYLGKSIFFLLSAFLQFWYISIIYSHMWGISYVYTIVRYIFKLVRYIFKLFKHICEGYSYVVTL